MKGGLRGSYSAGSLPSAGLSTLAAHLREEDLSAGVSQVLKEKCSEDTEQFARMQLNATSLLSHFIMCRGSG